MDIRYAHAECVIFLSPLTDEQAVEEHVRCLRNALEQHSKSTVVKNSDVLSEFLFKAFDFCRINEAGLLDTAYSKAQVEKVEQMVNEVAIALTMKLNDTVFRPFFIQLVEWATTTLPKGDRVGQSLRATSLFVFFAIFVDQLKVLGVTYSNVHLISSLTVIGSRY